MLATLFYLLCLPVVSYTGYLVHESSHLLACLLTGIKVKQVDLGRHPDFHLFTLRNVAVYLGRDTDEMSITVDGTSWHTSSRRARVVMLSAGPIGGALCACLWMQLDSKLVLCFALYRVFAELLNFKVLQSPTGLKSDGKQIYELYYPPLNP